MYIDVHQIVHWQYHRERQVDRVLRELRVRGVDKALQEEEAPMEMEVTGVLRYA